MSGPIIRRSEKGHRSNPFTFWTDDNFYFRYIDCKTHCFYYNLSYTVLGDCCKSRNDDMIRVYNYLVDHNDYSHQASQGNYPIIAGGSVSMSFLNLPYNDIDIYVKDMSQFNVCLNILADRWDIQEDEYWKIFLTDTKSCPFITLNPNNSSIIPHKIQLIKTWFFSDARHVLKTFDLSCCQSAIQGYRHGDYLVYCSDFFIDDIQNKKIRVVGRAEEPITLLYRISKYMKKGFTIDGVGLKTAIKNIAEQYPDIIQETKSSYSSPKKDTNLENEFYTIDKEKWAKYYGYSSWKEMSDIHGLE